MNEGRTERGRTLPVSSVALRIGFHYPFSFLLKNSFFFFSWSCLPFSLGWFAVKDHSASFSNPPDSSRSEMLICSLCVPCRRDCCQPGNQRALSGQAEPHQRNSRPSYFSFFFLSKQGPVFVDGLQAQKKKSPICFTVTWSAGLCPLFHFCFTCAFP